MKRVFLFIALLLLTFFFLTASLLFFTNLGIYLRSFAAENLPFLPKTWAKTIGGGGRSSTAYSVQKTSDNGFIVAGYTSAFGQGEGDVYLAKITTDGMLDAKFGQGGTRTVGGISWDFGNYIKQVRQTDKESFLAVGRTMSFGNGYFNIYGLKLTKEGNLDSGFGNKGTVTIGNDLDETAVWFEETPEGGYLIFGETSSYGQGKDDFYVVKLTPAGVLDSSFGIGGTITVGGSNAEGAGQVLRTADDSYLLIGSTFSFGAGASDVYLVKLTSGGKLDKTFGFGGTLTLGGERNDWGKAILELEDGFLVVGGTESFGVKSSDIYLAKIDQEGVLDKNFGNEGTLTFGGDGYEKPNGAIKTSDGGILIVGETDSFGAGKIDMYLVKLTKNGQIDRKFGINGTLVLGGAEDDRGYSVTESGDKGYLAVGNTLSFGQGSGSFEMFLVKVDGKGNTSGCIEKSGGGEITGHGGQRGGGGKISKGSVFSGGGEIDSGGDLTNTCE